MIRDGGALSGKKRGSPERTWRGRSSLLIFQDTHGVLLELAPACSRAICRPERGLPGFVGPVPPPLLISARKSSVVCAAFRLAACQIGPDYTRRRNRLSGRSGVRCAARFCARRAARIDMFDHLRPANRRLRTYVLIQFEQHVPGPSPVSLATPTLPA